MNILITGGAGFIGSHLSNHLANKYKNYRIIVLDKLDYSSNLENIRDGLKLENFKFYQGNILDLDLLSIIFQKEKIDIVFHLAAYTHVDHSFMNSIKFTENNVMGTNILLECSKKFQVKRFIYVSTDEVYGCIDTNNINSNDCNMIKEKDNDGACELKTKIQPTNPYSASKAAAELLVQAYQISFGLPTIITRGNNVYGPYQYPEKIIPKFISLLMNNKACTIHGTGMNLRSFIYISDMINAFDLILHKGQLGEIYNIGTDFEISNLNLTLKLLEMYQSKFPQNKQQILTNNNNNIDDSSSFIKFIKDRPFNDYRYNLNCSKLKELGWKQNISWEDGLKLTFNWYLSNPDYWKNKDYLNDYNYNITTSPNNGVSLIIKNEEEIEE